MLQFGLIKVPFKYANLVFAAMTERRFTLVEFPYRESESYPTNETKM